MTAEEIATKLADGICGKSFYRMESSEHKLIQTLKEALESYGKQEYERGLEDSAKALERYMRIDKYASQPEQRGLLINAPGIVRALKEVKS